MIKNSLLAIAFCLLAFIITLASAQDATLLVHKSIKENEAVVNTNVLFTITIYNVGQRYTHHIHTYIDIHATQDPFFVFFFGSFFCLHSFVVARHYRSMNQWVNDRCEGCYHNVVRGMKRMGRIFVTKLHFFCNVQILLIEIMDLSFGSLREFIIPTEK